MQPLVSSPVHSYTTSISIQPSPMALDVTTQLSRVMSPKAKSFPTEHHLSAESVSFAFSPTAKLPRLAVPMDDDLTYLNGQHESEYIHLSILDPYFDVTPSRVHMAFQEADPMGLGSLSPEQFRAALESMGIRCRDEAVFQTLVNSMTKGSNQSTISITEFERVVQKLKLGNLFEENTMALFRNGDSSSRFEVCDFSSKRLALYRPDLRSFFTSEPAPWVSCRWINMQGHDHLNLKRLAIKYRLHPLAMEDTIELNERPKFDTYNTHRFVVFPILHHTLGHRASSSDPRSNTLGHQPFGRLDNMNSKTWSTASTRSRRRTSSFLTTNDTEGEDERFLLTVEHVAIFLVGDDTLITVKQSTDASIWHAVHRRLASTYSKVRHNDANFLLYSVLDVIVDQMTGVMDDVRSYLKHLEHELDTLRHRFDIETLRDVHTELGQLPRVIKPTRDVLKSLLASRDLPDTTKAYLRDVHDHLNHILDEIEWQFQMCRSMTEEYRDAKAAQVNYVVYTLTIVTTVFLPAQFLTGVYGMNFDNMPELHSPYGYAAFWLILFCCTGGMHFYFRHKQWV
ncbi:magnesium and cobalt transporter CorA [Aphanomyces invadans]|uniref:Magnesium and cobalt transporter CorA n=1 Tax=Aphanomyces invadans TaxID=157072 RepID=A0A024U7Q7_9STRA|nr:magnesium and cobalt transporter CorA [Aphanomyces invadans]ETW02260.1 magnesium and cobalt transporter CorA [Aphanomyces invadans]|eukprot:XP_008868865.1 magnesium and cobalt transporter CorA [Aphanomyces invadans]